MKNKRPNPWGAILTSPVVLLVPVGFLLWKVLPHSSKTQSQPSLTPVKPDNRTPAEKAQDAADDKEFGTKVERYAVGPNGVVPIGSHRGTTQFNIIDMEPSAADRAGWLATNKLTRTICHVDAEDAENGFLVITTSTGTGTSYDAVPLNFSNSNEAKSSLTKFQAAFDAKVKGKNNRVNVEYYGPVTVPDAANPGTAIENPKPESSKDLFLPKTCPSADRLLLVKKEGTQEYYMDNANAMTEGERATRIVEKMFSGDKPISAAVSAKLVDAEFINWCESGHGRVIMSLEHTDEGGTKKVIRDLQAYSLYEKSGKIKS